MIDHHWSLAVLLLEFVAFVVAAFAIASLRGVIGPTATWYALVVLQLVFLLVVVADQVVGLLAMAWRGLRALVRGRPSPGEVAAETLPYEEWTMRLCHHEGDAGATVLLAEVSERLTRLAGSGAALACPRDGITTSTTRARVAAWADGLDFGDNPEISVRIPRQQPVRWKRIVDTGSFFWLWLVGVAVTVASSASVVTAWERDACAGACEGRPASFPAALEWLTYRLMWQEQPDVSAATFYTRSTGLMVGILGLFTPVIATFALIRYIRYRHELRVEYQRHMTEMFERVRVLLVVATPVELDAVLEEARAHCDADPVLDVEAGHPVFRLGVIGGVDVFLAQVGTGLTNPASAPYSVPELLTEWRPHYVIMPGICYGLREEHQRLGDIIIAEQLQVISIRAGESDIRDRGDKVTAGLRLIERFKLASPPPGARIWPGLMLSWDVLVDSHELRQALKAHYPDAQGGEMEGAALYAATRTHHPTHPEWLLAKAICDWAHTKNKDAQHQAAQNSAHLVLTLLATRALTPPPP